jgi:hypothetical protein
MQSPRRSGRRQLFSDGDRRCLAIHVAGGGLATVLGGFALLEPKGGTLIVAAPANAAAIRVRRVEPR